MEELLQELGALATSGVMLMVHLAPPCATFSRARCRSTRTRLRSNERPQGLPQRMEECREANLVACHALYLAESLARDYGAAVSMENPRSSLLWDFLDFDPDLDAQDVDFSACLFGAP